MNLVIDYLEIENFKSYYGKNILGPFHQSFNAVIGPNGSGKSNVIDSLLFVFGFRAQKIRTKKISILIHNSDQHPDVNSCSVKIFFKKIRQNTNDLVPNSEFTIKRTAYKDNSSEYYIDERKVQYKEVGQLLRECGVDLDHNRFLILQGEVESISLLKPKAANEHEEGLLEYLEDIIGTIRYKPQLESIAVEIDKINEIRTEKANRVQNLQKDKNSLEAPKNEAIRYLKKENEIIDTKNFYYQAKMYMIEKDLEKRQEECDQIQSEFDSLVKQSEEISKENQVVVEEASIKKKEHDKKFKLNEKLKKEFEDYEKEDVSIREAIKNAKEQIKKLTKTIETEKEKIANYTDLPEKNDQKIKELQEESKELENELDKANKLLKTKMDEVNKETNKLQDKKKPIETKVTQLQAVVNEAKTKMDLAQSELEVLMNNQNYEQKKLEEIKTKITDMSKSLKEKETQLKDTDASLPNLEAEFKKAEEELKELSANERKLVEMVKKNRQKYNEAQSSFSSNRNRGRVLSYVMKLKSEGKIKGIYGRMGDLGAIDEKYDVAVSTACGSLDCIIVDTMDTAQACVESLKQSHIGQAAFMALDKQEKWREYLNKKISTPENVPRLIDLIKVNDPKLLTAFYFSLRNTLVAENLEQATRIAYGRERHRVVTLKGEVIEPSGTMSGGGQPSRGRMGSKIVNDEYSTESIKKMQDSLTQDEQDLRELMRRKNQLETLLEELTRKIDNAKESINRLKFEIKSMNEQMISLRKNEENIMKRINEIEIDTEAHTRLQKLVEKHRLDYEKAETEASEVRNQNDELCKQIVDISKRILDKPKENLKDIEKRMDEINKLITTANVEIKSCKRNLMNSEKKLSSATEDLEQNESSLEQNQARLEQIDEESKKVLEKHESLKEECELLAKQIAEINKSIKQFESKLQKFETEKIDLNHKLEKQKESVDSNKRDLKYYEQMLNNLKLHDTEFLENGCINGNNNQMDTNEEEQTVDSENRNGPALKKYDEDDRNDADLKALKEEIHRLDEELKKENPNLNAIENYRQLQTKFMERVNELEQITQQRDQLCSDFDDLRKKRLDEFMGGFTAIRLKLKEIYRTVTLDGDAELELVDSLDPFTEGIVLSVRPPKKSWKNVSNLSGGEKTLSSLSLVFALHEFRSTPIYVMDEIDAALDFKNVSIIAHYIKERTKNAQFIIISLRNNMFELCDRLFGIYKVKNCTSATYISPCLLEFDEKKKAANTRQINSGNSNGSNNSNLNGEQSQQSTILQSQLANTTSNQVEMIEA